MDNNVFTNEWALLPLQCLYLGRDLLLKKHLGKQSNKCSAKEEGDTTPNIQVTLLTYLSVSCKRVCTCPLTLSYQSLLVERAP